jgi:DNA-binding response OmpR family regulator
VYSEPGKGTAIKLYLPVAQDLARPVTDVPPEPPLPAGTETVLLVEDDTMVRSLAREMLALHGYRVLEAQSGTEALRVLEESEGPIDLVLTDVVMPQMGGAELATRLAGLRPGLPVLFMSGYPDEALARHGMVDAGAYYLQKPFTAEALLRRVRDVLDVSEKG